MPSKISMGDRVRHPKNADLSGVVLYVKNSNAMVQFDNGERQPISLSNLTSQSGTLKTASKEDDAIIEQIADEVFDGESEDVDLDEPLESVVPDAGRAIYHGEDRDVSAPDGQSPHTTASVKTACSCGCEKGEGGECKCGPECDCPECGKLKKSAKGKCECWDGYKRVPGTKPCAPGSCEKCDSARKESKKHVDWWTDKENRQYEHIKKQYMDEGISEDEAAERAARTVNKGHGKSSAADEDHYIIEERVLPRHPDVTKVCAKCHGAGTVDDRTCDLCNGVDKALSEMEQLRKNASLFSNIGENHERV